MPKIVAGESNVRHCTIELGYSHQEFLRAVPKIFDPVPVTIEGTRIVANNKGKKVVLDLGPEQTRQLGTSFTLQDTAIAFTFHGYTEDEIEAFMKYFVIRTQRGGG